MIWPGDRADLAELGTTPGGAGHRRRHRGEDRWRRRRDGGWSIPVGSHPLLANLTADGGEFVSPEIGRMLDLVPGTAEVALRTTGGRPWLLRQGHGRGRWMLAATGLSPQGVHHCASRLFSPPWSIV